MDIKVEFENIDIEVSKCTRCNDMIEKFLESSTISFGHSNDLLILGEAPANNGWRKSGKVWCDLSGKFIPSGINLDYLFKTINFNLMDITFTEAIKCYPKKRKYVQKCSRNCRDFLIRQIYLLSPKVVVVLGDKAFRAVCNIEYSKFSDVVGKSYIVDFLDTKSILFPVYHPSPASPLCIKGNLELFQEIKNLLHNLI